MNTGFNLVVLVFMTCSPLAALNPGQDDPNYANWSRFPVGTSVTRRTTTSIKGNALPNETITKVTLVSKDDEKVVLEEILSTELAGEQIVNDPERYQYRRRVPGAVVASAKSTKTPPQNEAGEEKIEMLGKTFESEWYDQEGQTESGPSLTRTWIADDVPGRLLKAVTRVKSVQKETHIEVIEIKFPE